MSVTDHAGDAAQRYTVRWADRHVDERCMLIEGPDAGARAQRYAEERTRSPRTSAGSQATVKRVDR